MIQTYLQSSRQKKWRLLHISTLKTVDGIGYSDEETAQLALTECDWHFYLNPAVGSGLVFAKGIKIPPSEMVNTFPWLVHLQPCEFEVVFSEEQR